MDSPSHLGHSKPPLVPETEAAVVEHLKADTVAEAEVEPLVVVGRGVCMVAE